MFFKSGKNFGLILILCIIFCNVNCENSDQEAAEGQIKLDFSQFIKANSVTNNNNRGIGSNEESINDLFPPKDKSYFTPYGDRSIIVLQLPTLSLKDIEPPPSKYGVPPCKHEQEKYGPPPPPPVQETYYGPPTKPSKKRQDFGIIVSQNYIYRENHRDYANFAKIFNNSKPSDELFQQAAKRLAIAQHIKSLRFQSTENFNAVNEFSQGYGTSAYGPPKEKKSQSPYLVLVSIDSRVKVSTDSVRETAFTNGSIIFSSQSDSEVLNCIPFTLRGGDDVKNVLVAYGPELNSLPSSEKKQILSFTQLVEEVHRDSHIDGKERLERVRRLTGTFSRPRIPVQLYEESIERQQAEITARKTYWLHSSTVALRTISPYVEEQKQVWVPQPQPPPSQPASVYGSPSQIIVPDQQQWGTEAQSNVNSQWKLDPILQQLQQQVPNSFSQIFNIRPKNGLYRTILKK